MKEKDKRRTLMRVSFVLLSVFMLLILLSSAVSSQMLGDVNSDDLVDIRDVVLVQRHILGYQSPLSTAQLTAADVNGDGIVNVVDANLIMQYIQGYINSFPTHSLHAPTLISPAEGASVDSSMVSFQWGAVTGATRYQLEITRVSDGTIFRTVNLGNVNSITEYNFANDGAQYRWRVRAGSVTEWGAWSVRRTFTNGTAALPVPTLGFPANNASLDTESINFQWSSVAGAIRYQLEVVRVSDGFIFKNIELGNVTSASQSGFPNNGTEYRWRVRAGTIHTWGAWTTYRIFTSGVVVPAPTLTSPANKSTISGTSVLFRWNAVSGATKYQLEVFKGTESAPFKDVTVGNLTMSEQFGFQLDGATYSWRVRAGNNTGWGAWSNDFTFTGGSLVAAPVLVSPTADKNEPGRQVTFRWQDVTGAINYELEIVNERTGAFLTEASLGNVTSSIQRGFDDDRTRYSWRVRAASSEGWGAWSAYATFINGDFPGAPALSRPDQYENIGRSWTNFEWKPVPGADRYELEIRDSDDKVFRTAIIYGRTTSLQQDFPVDGGQYTWTVRSGNANGWSSLWAAARSFTVGSPFGFPTLLAPAANSIQLDARITFSWQALDNATRYNLEIIDVRTGQTRTNIIVDDPSSTQRNFPIDGSEYKWRVRAGDDNRWGSWSAFRHFISDNPANPTLASPTLLSPAAGATAATESIEFSWTAVTGAARYQIQVVRVADGQVVFDRERTPRSLTQGGFPNDGTEYLWRVRAIDGSGAEGPWSLYGSFINGAFWWNIAF